MLINNAGLSPLYPDLASVTEELYDKTHAVNAKGPFRLATLIATRMFAGDGGSIINVSTAGSWRPDEHDLPYAMAKAGLNALTLGLAGAYNPKVRANTVLPGPFETDITKAWGEGTIDMVNQSNPMRRIGQPAGHGRRVRVPRQRRVQLRERRADPLRRRRLPHALRAHVLASLNGACRRRAAPKRRPSGGV